LGLNMPSFSEDIKERLDEVILPIASSENPIDLTANVTDEMIDDVLRILQDEEKVDAIFLYALFQSPYVGEGMVDSISKWYHQGDKPIIVVCIGDKTGHRWREEFYKEGVPAYPSTKRAIDCLEVQVRRGKTLSRIGDNSDD
ncbi:MAG: CoA-binding protein, partial [Candidatus Thermoplasmatota archaeon]